VDEVTLLQIAAAFLLNLGLCWLAGSWCARRWLRAGGAGQLQAEDGLRRMDLLAAAVAAAASVAALLAATAVMGGVGLREACPMFWTMLTSTDYGRAGMVTVLAMLTLLGVRLHGGSGTGSSLAVLLCGVVFVLTRASMGHAGEEGYWTVVLAAEAIHLGAVAVWTGAVLVSGGLVLDGARLARLGLHDTDRYLDLMSQAALVAVIAIAATGIYNAWQRLGSPVHLVDTAYGVTLQVKAALVVVAIALGGYNKFIGLPGAARSAQGLQRVRLVLRLECVVLIGALAAAAALVSQQPPAAASIL
jgi:putative copper resistance protein D